MKVALSELPTPSLRLSVPVQVVEGKLEARFLRESFGGAQDIILSREPIEGTLCWYVNGLLQNDPDPVGTNDNSDEIVVTYWSLNSEESKA